MRVAILTAVGGGCLAIGAAAQGQAQPVFYMDFDDNVQIKGNAAYSAVPYELYGNAQYSTTQAPVLKSGKSVYLPQIGSRDAVGPAGLNAATTDATRRAFFGSIDANVPNIGASLTGSWTMEAWVKSTTTANDGSAQFPPSLNEGIVMNLSRKGGDTWGGDPDPYLWGYGSRSHSITASHVSTGSGTGRFHGRAYFGAPTNPNYWHPSQGTYESNLSTVQPAATNNDWKHVAMVYDASAATIQMYVNGQASGSPTAVDPAHASLAASFSQTDGLFPIIGADKFNDFDYKESGWTGADGTDTLWHTFQGYIDQPVLWADVVTPQDEESGFQGAIGDARIAGDANFDGIVGLSDLSILAGKWEATVPYGRADADFNIDGLVNLADLSILAGNWGFGEEGDVLSLQQAMDFVGLTNAVPEPASLSLIGLSALGLLRRRHAAQVSK